MVPLFFSALFLFWIWRYSKIKKKMCNDTLNERREAVMMDKVYGIITEEENDQKIKWLIKYRNSLKTVEYICTIVLGLMVIAFRYICLAK
jgi:hypothetical protein